VQAVRLQEELAVAAQLAGDEGPLGLDGHATLPVRPEPATGRAAGRPDDTARARDRPRQDRHPAPGEVSTGSPSGSTGCRRPLPRGHLRP
jgi:hypothetical protein